MAGLFDNWVTIDEAHDLFLPVTTQELKTILAQFKKEKSLGPDGWTVEFF
jgi:hypothetical protein